MNSLLDEILLSTGAFAHAAIIRRKDMVLKAKSSLFPIPNEISKIPKLFEQPLNTREQGFTLGGLPYKAVRVDQWSIYARVDKDGLELMRYEQRKNSDAMTSAFLNEKHREMTGEPTIEGMISCRTGMFFIVGFYQSHPGIAVEAAEKLADYFRQKGK
ncbi:hypothetical protein BKA69DRAFT_1039579 [Paraphysoderma sedebokerense]|nr:hypothetical protein BKA69DRAFT_1039579 [Paraphysoderma sedebokerense]